MREIMVCGVSLRVSRDSAGNNNSQRHLCAIEGPHQHWYQQRSASITIPNPRSFGGAGWLDESPENTR